MKTQTKIAGAKARSAQAGFTLVEIMVVIIILGLLGLVFDLVMRWVIKRTIPWRGKG